jgi:hypothetical protein
MAEDITLDVFTQIWKNADKYHSEKGQEGIANVLT